MSFTKDIARFIVNIKYEDLPYEVREQSKRLILDTIGCTLAGYKMEHDRAKLIIDYVREIGGTEESTVFVEGFKTACPNAALANCVMSHSNMFDDSHMMSFTHAGSVITSATLSAAEKAKSNGKDIITAAVVGYEVGVRVGMSIMPSSKDLFHPTGINGTFCAVASAGKLFGLDQIQMENALGLAGTQAAGLMAFVDFGDFTKSLNPAKAAMNGIMAALLAEKGCTGPENILEHRLGYCQAHCREKPKFEKLTDGLGEKYEILQAFFKAFPALSGAGSSMEATIKLMKDHSIKPGEIEKITARTYDVVLRDYMNYEPDTVLAARLSQPYCIAIAALEQAGGLEQFTEQKIRDPRVRQFMRKVEIAEDPNLTKLYPEKIPFIVQIMTKDGQVYSHSLYYPKGHPSNPMSWDETKDKFRNNAKLVFDKERVDSTIDTIYKLDDIAEAGKLTRILGRAE